MVYIATLDLYNYKLWKTGKLNATKLCIYSIRLIYINCVLYTKDILYKLKQSNIFLSITTFTHVQ